MYFLGLFTSHVPYIVIIAVYAVYFLTYSVNKLNLPWKSNTPEVIEIQQIASCDQHGEKQIDYYDSCSEDNSIDTEDNPPIFHFQGLAINRIIIAANMVPDSYFGFVFFPRPPPSMV